MKTLIFIKKIDEDKLLESYHVERPLLNSFTDTVRALERCELVICADTSVAHLAASMGIPTWILIPYVPDWRWLLNRNDSPWYPSVKLFRQNRLSSWDEPILEITQSLLKKKEPRLSRLFFVQKKSNGSD